MERITLIASEGKVYTNGTAAGSVVYLSATENPDDWYEISIEEYEAKEAEEMAAFMR